MRLQLICAAYSGGKFHKFSEFVWKFMGDVRNIHVAVLWSARQLPGVHPAGQLDA